MAKFYSARSKTIPPLPWQTFALPFSLSEHAAASTLEFVKLFAEAGFPAGVVNTVTGMPLEVGVPLVSHPDVAKIAFTGGEPGALRSTKPPPNT